MSGPVISRWVKNLTRRKFGRLRVIRFAGYAITGKRQKRVALWHCACKCGARCVIRGNGLQTGNTESCGCLFSEKLRARNFRHGLSKSRIYSIYNNMLARCYDKKNPAYKQYGGRGIRVCRRWLGKNGFINFVADLGHPPSRNHTLDRYPDNDDGYKPGNVRWATQLQQVRNLRTNRRITFRGETHCISEWAEITGIGARRIWKRLQRWSVSRALSTPVRIGRWRGVKVSTKGE